MVAALDRARVDAVAGGEQAQGDHGEEEEHENHVLIVPYAALSAQMLVILISIMEHDQWLGVEVRHFAALQAIAEEGSFGRAAERLGYTQSAVSQQVATLERIVGEQLVERPGGPRPVSLTEAGRLLLHHADAIVGRLRAAKADLHALQAGEAGTLRVGAFQSVGARVLPEVMRRFAEEWPKIEVMLDELEDDESIRAIELGSIDVGFVQLPIGETPLETLELLRDPYVLIVQAGSPLARRRPSLEEVAAQTLVGFRDHHSLASVTAAFDAAGLEPRWAFRSNDNPTLQGLVAAGLGASVMPLLTIDPADTRIEVVDLADAIPPRILAVAWHRDRYASPALRAFVETARAAVATRP